MIYFGVLLFLLVIFIFTIIHEQEAGVPVFFIASLLSIPWIGSYSNHADNIATIQEQHRVVTVYNNRIEALTLRMKGLSSSDVKMGLLNADTPIASMVKSVTEFEYKLAEAEEKKAVAYQRIVSRKLGFFNSVTWFFDDIKDDKQEKK